MPAATTVPPEMVNSGNGAQEKAGQLRACLPPPCLSFVFLQEARLVVGSRKGGELGRGGVGCLFIGTLKFLLKTSERQDFPQVDRAKRLCRLQGREKSAQNKESQTCSRRQALGQLTARRVSVTDLRESVLSRTRGMLPFLDNGRQRSRPWNPVENLVPPPRGEGAQEGSTCPPSANRNSESPLSHRERKHLREAPPLRLKENIVSRTLQLRPHRTHLCNSRTRPGRGANANTGCMEEGKGEAGSDQHGERCWLTCTITTLSTTLQLLFKSPHPRVAYVREMAEAHPNEATSDGAHCPDTGAHLLGTRRESCAGQPRLHT